LPGLRWVPAYASVWGWTNLLHLCDIAVILTCAGLWFGSPLLLSSQAVSSIVVDLVWDLDVGWRLLSGKHLVGGTEYMWSEQVPLAVRLLSLFPLRRIQRQGCEASGYDGGVRKDRSNSSTSDSLVSVTNVNIFPFRSGNTFASICSTWPVGVEALATRIHVPAGNRTPLVTSATTGTFRFR